MADKVYNARIKHPLLAAVYHQIKTNLPNNVCIAITPSDTRQDTAYRLMLSMGFREYQYYNENTLLSFIRRLRLGNRLLCSHHHYMECQHFSGSGFFCSGACL